MVNTKLNLSMTEPYVRQIYAKEGDTGRVLEIGLEDYPTENGTLRILRPDGVEVTADAIKSASGDAYKGDLVTFDALEEVPLTKCEVTLEPVQDLSNGDPSPTNICPIEPSNGKNLFSDATNSGTSASLTYNTFTPTIPLKLEVGKTYTISCDYEIERDGSASATLSVGAGNGTGYSKDIGQKTGLPMSGHVSYTFTPTADQLATYEYLALRFPRFSSATTNVTWSIWNIQVEVGSFETAYRPYNGIVVEQSGENFIANATIVQGGFNTSNGLDYPNTTRLRTQNYNAVSQGTYKICCDESYEWVCYVYSTSDAFIDAESQKTWQTVDKLMTIVGDRHIRVSWRKSNNATIEASEIHHPYVIKSADYSTHSISLGRKVYGGYVDLVSEKLVVTHIQKKLTATASTAMGYRAGYARAYIGNFLSGADKAPTGTITDFYCDTVEPKNIYSVSANGIYIYQQTNLAMSVSFDSISGYTDSGSNSNYVDAINQFITDNDIYIVYPLATPIEIQL